MARAEHIALLEEALAQPIGLVLRSSDRERCRQVLYQARTAAGDPRFSILQFRLVPGTDDQIVIMRAQQAGQRRAFDRDLEDAVADLDGEL